jgi:hypothetical protein
MPARTTGWVPIRVNSCEETLAAMMNPLVSGRYAMPVWIGE